SIIFNDYSTTRTSALPLQDALPISSLILALAGCAGTADRESTGEYIDDAAITAHVKTALIRQDEVKARNINVETFRGTVQLSGFVDSREESRRAEETAKGVSGVKKVQNDLQIRSKQ